MIDTTLIDALTERMRRESEGEKGKENITDMAQLTSERKQEGQGGESWLS